MTQTTQVIRCDACGGTVAYDAEREAAACIFCASVSVTAGDGEEAMARPSTMLPFEVDADAADTRFRRWSRSSWWYAEPVRRLSVALSPMLVPVWHCEAAVETHWAGIVPARGRSGGRPRSGVDHADLTTAVPASLGLSEAELAELLPFRDASPVPFDASIPHEVPSLSERAASDRARQQLVAEHRQRLVRTNRLTHCNVSSLTRLQHVALTMMPIYIGSFRYRDRPWRFVINGQTGAVAGRPPLDRRKIAAAIVVVVTIIAAIVWWRAG